MCLAIPMKILEVSEDASGGRVEIDGAVQRVDLSLIDSPREGDFVIVHAGFAIEKLDAEEAEGRIALFEEIAADQAALQ